MLTLASFCLVPMMINSVLSSFSFNLSWSIHFLMSTIQFCMAPLCRTEKVLNKKKFLPPTLVLGDWDQCDWFRVRWSYMTILAHNLWSYWNDSLPSHTFPFNRKTKTERNCVKCYASTALADSTFLAMSTSWKEGCVFITYLRLYYLSTVFPIARNWALKRNTRVSL